MGNSLVDDNYDMSSAEYEVIVKRENWQREE